MKVTILGGGLAGIIAANVLHRHNPVVIEAQPTIPDNHSAVLRFRTDTVSRATGIKFERATVRKGIWDGEHIHSSCNVKLANAYSQNVLGQGMLEDRSIWNMEPSERFIAPDDFIKRAAGSTNILLNTPFKKGMEFDGLVISTLPMPIMVSIFGKTLGFSIDEMFTEPPRPVFTINGRLKGCKTHQTIYNGKVNSNTWYRASLQGEKLIIESSKRFESVFQTINGVSQAFGAFLSASEITASEQKAGKMSAIDETQRQRFISLLSDEFGIYSLGRLATHRPKLLLDELPGDIETILKIKDSKYLKTKNTL